jgi:uncharacterized membrane protein
MKKELIGLYLLIGTAAAETTQFRLGHLVGFLFDILGFNITDLTTAIPDYLFLIVLAAIGGLIFWFVKWRKK